MVRVVVVVTVVDVAIGVVRGYSRKAVVVLVVIVVVVVV